MADSINPNANNNYSANFLPRFYRTDTNKKFLQATLDQLIQPGTVKKLNGFVGRQNAKATTGDDIFITAVDSNRQNYQLEPGLVVNDTLDNTTFFKDYQDYINQLGVFGGNTTNHARINDQEFYSWDPHIDWDKFVNFQNYYWLPYGPEPIRIIGQRQEIVSTYTVLIESQGDNNAYIFTPDGLVRNPTITLYRGQTYNFEINSPGNPFSIKTHRTPGFLNRYTTYGLTDFAVENGTITFTVPFNSPDVLYYQSETDIDLGGVIQVLSIDENTSIDVEKEIIGKKTYTLSNGTELSNGMKVLFGGIVTPAEYSVGQYYVEGVGTSIRLVNESILELISPYTVSETILFDTLPFDKQPFSDATAFATSLDYIVINRSSTDHNPWSRYNRWFHKDAIEASAIFNGKVPSLDQDARAVRPIIEFEPNLKLFNFGTTAIADVDLIDDYTVDVFSTIEGSQGYNVDGIDLAQGQRILFTADPDILVKNKIYEVTFIEVRDPGRTSISRQIHLVEVSTPVINQVALIKQGNINQGQMYWYNNTTWVKGQQKTQLNQAPLFDIVDSDGVGYSDTSVYEGSTFAGTKLFSYKIGTGATDANLGFALSYKNIANIGDIVFDFNLAFDQFQYRQIADIFIKDTNVGYLIKSNFDGSTSYVNGWQLATTSTVQAAIRIYKNSNLVNNFELDLFDDKNNLTDLKVRIYINGIRLDKSKWQIVDGPTYKKIVLSTDILQSDVLTIRAFAKQPINKNGYYEIPINLQNNPLNTQMVDFTLGEVIDHVNSIVDNLPTFIGNYPGPSNLRDLGNITPYGIKFVQHSGPISLSLYHVTSETNNIVRAMEKARDDYNKFKKNFLIVAENLGYDANSITMVNLILKNIHGDKSNTSPYYFSDMVGYGANLKTEFTVIDYRIKTYPLTKPFSLDSLNTQAVNIYVNNTQLLAGRDYSFNSQGFVVITATLENDDVISIYEYDSTDGCFIPETPTVLGMWPKFEPKIYLDTSYNPPRTMIQGHDGSLVLAYGDYRDDLILELEKRIFNNIKVSYDSDIFDIYDEIPSYNRENKYSLEEFNEVLSPSFYKWASLIDRDFTKPLSYDRDNSFTYNYRGHTAPDGRETPGYWRGIYRWLLDTDRPHICPWEMLGFTTEPTWWTTVYGPAPYTSDNLIMWEDISKGLVKEPGVPVVRKDKFVKSFLLKHIPVDASGNLISPQLSGLSAGVITAGTSGDYVFGDVSPVESAWRKSSHYPFSVIISCMLLSPARTFGVLLDRSRIVRNIANQLVYKDTGLRVTPKSIKLPSIYSSSTRVQTSGIVNYLINYILSDNLKSYNSYQYDLNNITSQLSHRLAGFTSKEKFNLLLDSKSPLSSGSVFVPPENYNIILNSSSPIKKITYSGVIINKLEDGFTVSGYSKTQPYFKYYPWSQIGIEVNVGGISESYSVWTSNQQYSVGKIVAYDKKYYRVTVLHTTTTDFEAKYYQSLSKLPIIGGRNAIFRKAWHRDRVLTAPYGIKFRTVQDVVDFLVGYGEWLKDQGFVFDDFNTNLNAVTNWETSAKEFMFWTTQNWSTGEDKWDEWLPNVETKFGSIIRYNGDYYRAIKNSDPSTIFLEDDFVKLDGLSTIGSSVISLSPAAAKLTFSVPYSVVDDIKNEFNGYEIFRVDGTPIAPNFLNSFREDNAVSYTPQDQDGIFGATFYLVQKEQVVILSNTTLFNDTIYNPESGYRQERIKVSGYLSINWNGSFNAPGFIFDQAKINDWQAWQDYNLGDIVKYKEFYYSASAFLPGVELFIANNWIKLDSKPTPKLLPNWSYKASQFADFYSLDSDNFDISQQKMAQHLIGYQKRQYLENIIQNDVSEFKFYQGMIVEKGTQNVLNKLFDVLSADGEESLKFYEEWALRVGQYGANGAYDNIEFILDENEFKNNPQGFELVPRIDPNKVDFISRQSPTDIYLKPIGYNSNPWPIVENYSPYLRTPGYVRASEVRASLKTIDDIVNEDVTQYINGDYVWCSFEGASWNVYRYTDTNIKVSNVIYTVNKKELSITTEDLVNLQVGEYIGISQVSSFSGFYKVSSVSLNNFTVSAEVKGFIDPFAEQNTILIFKFVSQRVTNETLNDGTLVRAMDRIDSVIPSELKPGELLWTDDRGDGKWATWKHNNIFVPTTLAPGLPSAQLGYGKSVAINQLGDVAVASTNNGESVVYDKAGIVSPWLLRQTITRPFVSILDANLDSQIATKLAMSLDGTWLATSSPTVSNVASKFKEVWSGSSNYVTGDIVTVSAQPYEALQNSNDKDPLTQPAYWKIIAYIPVDADGTNSLLQSQGVISLYKKDNNNIYTLVDTILSPEPAGTQLFGSSLVFGTNTLFVGSVGHDGRKGRVYKLKYSTSVEASSAYNPVGSAGTTVVLTSTVGIAVGMAVQGTGFASGTLVSQVVNSTTIRVSIAPESTPSGLVSFTLTYWRYDTTGTTTGQQSNSHYGFSIALSSDNSIMLVGAPDATPGGKVFIYKLGTNGYVLIQTISSTNARFGQSITISTNSDYIAISDIFADGTKIDQGNVVVYKNVSSTTTPSYTLYQTLTSSKPEVAGFFGSKVAFMNNYKTLVVYSLNADTSSPATFNVDQVVNPTTTGEPTTFDKNTTIFKEAHVDSGRVDVYDMYASKWVFSESLENNNDTDSGYGQGLAVGSNHIFVSAPYAVVNSVIAGTLYDYSKFENTYSWTMIHTEIDKTNVSKIKQAFLYDKKYNKLITYLDVIDPIQGKIPGIADEEISFKTFYDPAVYSVGNSTLNVDDGTAWAKNQVGRLWWDLRTIKFIDSYEDDIVYRNSTWNSLAVGASVDVYEWVESKLLPSAWDTQSDTETGLALGISGTSLYGDSAYAIVRRYDNISKTFKNTYYYWVKNKKTIPNVPGRNLSAQDVADLIGNPRGEGYSYLALTGPNSFSLVNIKNLLDDKNIVLSVEYWTIDKIDQNIHSQWKLISEDANTVLPAAIEQKWFDSLCGKDIFDRVVPDTTLPPKLRYGIENRPRQGMFVNRFEALKQFIEKANIFLLTQQIVSNRDLTALDSYDTEPSALTGTYDVVLDTDAELRFAGVGSFQRPSLSPVIVDGKIIDITIVTKGNGYLNAPFITIVGSGVGAKIKAKINTKGQIIGADILSTGEGYTDNTILIIRDFSALVHNDSQSLNNWSVYSYDPVSQVWSRTQSQKYDVRKYWTYADWYATGYNQFTAINYAVDTFAELSQIESSIGDIVKIRTTNNGTWLLLEKYSNVKSVDWTQTYRTVGNQNGTIQLSSSLYEFDNTIVGYDGSLYDGSVFDSVAASELRIILNTLKNNIFIDNMRSQYLNLFFTCVRYALSEQHYLDWIFKTSFVKSKHNVGELHQPVNYRNDNLSNFEDYVDEVKPYRTKVREYISSYSKTDIGELSVTDFDIPPTYEGETLSVITTNIVNGNIESDNPAINSYPWKHWLDNVGFGIISIKLINNGASYITEPVVRIISSSGTGATARAFISNGKVNRIILLTSGSGYLEAPEIIIDGGVADGGTSATAVAIIGNSVVRSSLIKIKFDRLTQSYFVTQLEETETFTGTGSRKQFALQWAPDARISKSTVLINGVQALRSNYKLATVTSTSKGYTSYSGTITFDTAPANGAIISVEYIKNWDLLNAADRIQYYYNPGTGDIGKDLAQLMTGIDYGGVIISGLDFEVGSGWGSLPYYTDKWDTFDATFDDYIITVGEDTHEFELPYVPESGTLINIYYVKRRQQSYVSDGETLVYSYDFLISNPTATVERSVQTADIETFYNPVGSVGTTLKVINTAGISAGMTIINNGFASGQTVVQVVNLTTLIISAVPNTTPNELIPLIFTRNIAGSFVLYLENILPDDIAEGDIVTSPDMPDAFGYGTKVVSIDSVNNTVTLDQILFQNLPTNTEILFDHDLIIPTDITIYANGTFILTNPVPSGSTIYITGTSAPIRLDDPYYGTVNQTNSNAIMLTPVANGTSNTFTIPGTFDVFDKDKFILRKSTSDGSIKPQENDYDTALSGGNLAYSTATGLAADDILVDGDGFVTPTSSAAPEEVVPGQVVDAVAIKVYDKPSAGSANIKIDSYVADGDKVEFKITQLINSPEAVIVKITSADRDPITDEIISTAEIQTINVDYTVDYTNGVIIFETAPDDKSLVSIFSFGFNGSDILDLDYFISDGTNTEFITRAPWLDTFTPLIYIDGMPAGAFTPELFKTDNTYESSNRIGIRFSIPPANGSLVNFIIVSGDQQTFAITKTERISTNGGLVYALDYPIGDSLPIESNMIVRVDQEILKGPNNSYFTIKNNRLNYNLDPTKFVPYSIDVNKLIVLADGDLLTVGTDYIVDLSGITIKLNRSTYRNYSGKSLIVSVRQGQGYSYVPALATVLITNWVSTTLVTPGGGQPTYHAVVFTIPEQTFAPSVGANYSVTGNNNEKYNGTFVCLNSTTTTITLKYRINPGIYSSDPTIITSLNGRIVFTESYDDTRLVEVISSYKHDILDIQRTAVNVTTSLSLTPNTPEYYNYTGVVGGKLTLDRAVINDNYVWVIRNGTLLTPSVDFILLEDKQTIKLTFLPNLDDEFVLITYGSNVLTSGIAYMQFKDMLNRVHFKRLSLNKQTKLVNDLRFTDLTIEVEDASNFDLPNPSKNKPGVIEIRGERIEFFTLDGNVLGQLRRGTLGTGTPTLHKAGTYVQEIGPSESVPYTETSIVQQVVSDGTNILPLTFVPTLDATSFVSWFNDYGYTFRSTYTSAVSYAVNDAVIYNNLYYTNILAVPSPSGRKVGVNYSPANSTYWSLFDFNIPVGYGQSNDIEVFVGGYDTTLVWASSVEYAVGTVVNVGSYTYRCITSHTSGAVFNNDSANWQFFIGNIRLKKKPYAVHNVNQAANSPEGDIQITADFAVDGESKELRLTNKLSFGTKVTVVKRNGVAWDNTTNILASDTKIARFLKGSPGVWYTNIKFND